MPASLKLVELRDTAAGHVPAQVSAATLPPTLAPRVALPDLSPGLGAKLVKSAGEILTVVIPPLIVLAAMLLVWQVACSDPKSSLPSPTKIWADSKDLILDPFFVNGSQDIGQGDCMNL